MPKKLEQVFKIIGVLQISLAYFKILVKESILCEVAGCTSEVLEKRNSITLIFEEFCKNFE